MKYQKKTRPAPWVSAFGKPVPREVKRRIKAMSATHRHRLKMYTIARRAFLALNPRCAVFNRKQATEVHHIRGRTGPLLLDQKHWLAVSAEGHRWIHEHPMEAQGRGWLARRGEWGNPG